MTDHVAELADRTRAMSESPIGRAPSPRWSSPSGSEARCPTRLLGSRTDAHPLRRAGGGVWPDSHCPASRGRAPFCRCATPRPVSRSSRGEHRRTSLPLPPHHSPWPPARRPCWVPPRSARPDSTRPGRGKCAQSCPAARRTPLVSAKPASGRRRLPRETQPGFQFGLSFPQREAVRSVVERRDLISSYGASALPFCEATCGTGPGF
jgi:hypothetical protein